MAEIVQACRNAWTVWIALRTYSWGGQGPGSYLASSGVPKPKRYCGSRGPIYVNVSDVWRDDSQASFSVDALVRHLLSDLELKSPFGTWCTLVPKIHPQVSMQSLYYTNFFLDPLGCLL